MNEAIKKNPGEAAATQTKCWMCGEYYERSEDKEIKLVKREMIGSIEVSQYNIPGYYQDAIAHNLTCPNRPGGTTFINWFKWKIRRWKRRLGYENL